MADFFDDIERFRIPVPDIQGYGYGVYAGEQSAPTDPYLRGPIPYLWLAAASRCSGKAFRAGLMVQYLRTVFHTDTVYLSGELCLRWGIKPNTGYRGVVELAQAGLITTHLTRERRIAIQIVDTAEPPLVTEHSELLDGVPTSVKKVALFGTARGQFLKGPISLSWLTYASHLPGKALQVGVLVWFMTGKSRKREAILTHDRLQLWGISHDAARRALLVLETHRLVVLHRQPGKRFRVALAGVRQGEAMYAQ